MGDSFFFPHSKILSSTFYTKQKYKHNTSFFVFHSFQFFQAELEDPRLFLCTRKAHLAQTLRINLLKCVSEHFARLIRPHDRCGCTELLESSMSFQRRSVYVCKSTRSPFIPMGTTMSSDEFAKLLLPFVSWPELSVSALKDRCELLWRILDTSCALVLHFVILAKRNKPFVCTEMIFNLLPQPVKTKPWNKLNGKSAC